MLNLIKAVHTLIWLVMTLSVFYIGFSVIRMEFRTLFYVSLILIGSEIIVIVVNSWKCPLTGIARRHTDDAAPNFDIFLPRIIAQYNKEIFTVILLIILAIYLKNTFR
jgi:hypothetical protein